MNGSILVSILARNDTFTDFIMPLDRRMAPVATIMRRNHHYKMQPVELEATAVGFMKRAKFYRKSGLPHHEKDLRIRGSPRGMGDG